MASICIWCGKEYCPSESTDTFEPANYCSERCRVSDDGYEYDESWELLFDDGDDDDDEASWELLFDDSGDD